MGGHGSAIYMIECQVEYAIQGIIELINRKAASIRVKEQVDKEYQEWVQKDMKGRVFEDNTRCVSWYRNSKGINYTLWPYSLHIHFMYSSCTLHIHFIYNSYTLHIHIIYNS